MKTMSKIAAGLVLACASTFASADIVSNGGFDDGLNSWSCFNGDMCAVGTGNPGYAFEGYVNNGYSLLSQDVATVNGGIYRLTFDSRSYATNNEIGFSFTDFSDVVWVAATTDWVSNVASFTATGAANLQFWLATDPGTGTYRIDNVSLVQTGTVAAVPEPGSLALLGLAIAGFAAACRKRSV